MSLSHESTDRISSYCLPSVGGEGGGGLVDELLNYSRRDRATDELSHIVSPQAIILLISKVFIRDIIFDAVECKTVDFSSKAAKKSVKRGVRVLRALTARASHV